MTASHHLPPIEGMPSVLMPMDASGLPLNDNRNSVAAASTGAHAATIALIRELSRQRTDIQRAELRLTLQIGAIGRRMAGVPLALDTQTHDDSDHPASDEGQPSADTQSRGALGSIEDATGGDPDLSDDRQKAVSASATLAALPLIEARDHLVAARKPIEKRLEKLAKTLPVYPWVASVRGFGALSFAKIIGETGDLSNYDNPAKVWKRLGLAVMEDGTRQRRVAGAEALEHGYAPQRRSLMYVIGDGLVKQNQTGAYRTAYDRYKVYQEEIHPELTPMQRHLRAKRYMEKRLLLHLWRAWRRAAAGESFDDAVILNESWVQP